MCRLFFLLILFSVGCSNEEPWSSSDYFLGSWEFEESSFNCCEECVENYEEECIRFDGPFHGEITFLENGDCFRNWEKSGNIDTLVWCYNANARVLALKNEDGAFSAIKRTFNIEDTSNDSFTGELFSFMFFRITSFERK